jgi:hypothetical protein
VVAVRGAKGGSARQPDPVWDALGKLEGEPTNKNERGKLNVACQLIKESLSNESPGLSYEETSQLVTRRWHKMISDWPEITPTALALANNWKLFMPHQEKPAANERPEWIEEEDVYVPATPEQLAEMRKVVFGSV